MARIVKLRPTSRFPDGAARWARGLIGASPGGLFVRQVQIITIMVVASGFGDTGAYSVYTFVNAVYTVPYAVLAVPIATAVSPRLSEAAALLGGPSPTSLTTHSIHLVLDVGIITVALLVVLVSPVGLASEILRPARGADVVTFAMAPGLTGYALIYRGLYALYTVKVSRVVVLVNSLTWLSACAALGASVAIGIDGGRQTFIAIGVSVSVGTVIGATDQVAAICRAAEKRTTVGMTRSALIVGAASAIGVAPGHMAVRLVLGVLGIGGIGAFASAAVGGVVVLSAGGGIVFLFDRDALHLVGGMKEPGVEGGEAEGPDVEGPVSDGADTQ